MLLGGALGSLLDRLLRGYVIDFVDAGIGSLRWYTFNVADSSDLPSTILLLLAASIWPSVARRPRTMPDHVPVAGGDAREEEVRRMLIGRLEAARADRWATDLVGLSRSHVEKTIADGRLTVAGQAVKANTFVGRRGRAGGADPPPAPAAAAAGDRRRRRV